MRYPILVNSISLSILKDVMFTAIRWAPLQNYHLLIKKFKIKNGQKRSFFIFRVELNHLRFAVKK